MPSSCNLTLCTLQIALSRLHDIYLVVPAGSSKSVDVPQEQ